MYLDGTNSVAASLSQFFGKSEAEEVPEGEVRPPGAHLMLQPSLNHKYKSPSDDSSTASDEFAAPGGHYIKGVPDTMSASSSKYGQSVRQKKQRSFPKAPSVQDTPEDVRKPTSPPSFKRRNKREDLLAKEAMPDEDMPKDEWDAFMKDLEATEKQFETPPSKLLSYYESDSDSEMKDIEAKAPPPAKLLSYYESDSDSEMKDIEAKAPPPAKLPRYYESESDSESIPPLPPQTRHQ
jgi:hypothetical protein